MRQKVQLIAVAVACLFVCLFAGMLLGFWVSQQYNSIQGERWESAMKSVQKVHLSY